MTYSNSLADHSDTLILDTSVLINLHASGYGSRIIEALPNDIVISELVVTEFGNERAKVSDERQFLNDLVASGKARVVSLSEGEIRLFAALVSGAASVDDGEAATIAIAFHRIYRPVIDERKGRQKAVELCPRIEPGWSLDLFRHPIVRAVLGEDHSTTALYHALLKGRMRIHASHAEDVIALIGSSRALDCISLPGYKMRSSRWSDLKSPKL